jgi:putative ABC transport system permease protein
MSQAALQVVAAIAFAAFAVVLAWRMRVDLSRELGVAAIRAIAQLTVVGAVIALVFAVPALSFVFVAVMALTASLTSASRLHALPHSQRLAAIAIALPAIIAVALLIAIGAFDPTPRSAVPTAGIFIGGAMTATTLAGRRLLEALSDAADEIETRLSLGDDARTALHPSLSRAVTTALVPVIDQTRSVGLVTLPGTFVGLVLGGASPAEAARIQLLVLLALLAIELSSALLISEFIARSVIAPGERVIDLVAQRRQSGPTRLERLQARAQTWTPWGGR